MSDGSLATLMEDWICTQIRAIKVGDDNVFAATDVEPWSGTYAENVQAFAEELFTGQRNLVCRVFYDGDRVVQLEEGEIKVIPRFRILVGMKNRRPQEARRGDGTLVGTNRIRNLLQYALSDDRPDDGEGKPINDGTNAVERVTFTGSQVLVNQQGLCIQQTTIEIEEVLLAT